MSERKLQWVYFSNDKLYNAIRSGLAEGAELVLNRMAMFTPRITGNLLKSRFYRLDKTAFKLFVGASSKYARFVHEGTGIYNRQGQGRQSPWVYYNRQLGHFVRTVGQRPKPFIEEAVNATIDDIPGRITKRINAVK